MNRAGHCDEIGMCTAVLSKVFCYRLSGVVFSRMMSRFPRTTMIRFSSDGQLTFDGCLVYHKRTIFAAMVE